MGWILEFLDRLLGLDALDTTGLDLEERRRLARRDRSFIGLFMLGVSLHIAWSCGWLPGLSGFAFASDIKSTSAQLSERVASVSKRVDQVDARVLAILRLQLHDRIRALVVERCRTDDPSTRTLILRELAALHLQYYELFRIPAAEPPCRE